MAGNGKYNFSANFFLLYQIVTLIRKKKKKFAPAPFADLGVWMDLLL